MRPQRNRQDGNTELQIPPAHVQKGVSPKGSHAGSPTLGTVRKECFEASTLHGRDIHLLTHLRASAKQEGNWEGHHSLPSPSSLTTWQDHDPGPGILASWPRLLEHTPGPQHLLGLSPEPPMALAISSHSSWPDTAYPQVSPCYASAQASSRPDKVPQELPMALTCSSY